MMILVCASHSPVGAGERLPEASHGPVHSGYLFIILLSHTGTLLSLGSLLIKIISALYGTVSVVPVPLK